MKLKVIATCAVLGALSVPVVAQAGSATKVTGGGQSLADGKDTIGFNAQVSSTGAVKGQVQFVDRAADGSTQTQYHGTVTCFTQIGPNAAYLGGTWRTVNGDPDEGAEFFRLYVEDNGEPNQGRDMIFVDEAAPDPTCDDDDAPENEDQISLARGNVQFHAARSRSGRKAKPAAPSVARGVTTSLAGLR